MEAFAYFLPYLCHIFYLLAYARSMSEIKLLIFDLDGTINDSSPGIKYCFRKTGEFYGKHDLTDEELRYGLTGPFEENIKKVLGLRDDQIPEAIDHYVEFYVREGQSMSEMFPNMNRMLHYLRDRGYVLGLATMMVEKFAKQTLHDYGVEELFDTIHGANFTIPYTKSDLIHMCLESTGIDAENAVMIGDGEDDYNASVKAGVCFIGATYGYGIDSAYCKDHNIPFIEDPVELSKMF